MYGHTLGSHVRDLRAHDPTNFKRYWRMRVKALTACRCSAQRGRPWLTSCQQGTSTSLLRKAPENPDRTVAAARDRYHTLQQHGLRCFQHLPPLQRCYTSCTSYAVVKCSILVPCSSHRRSKPWPVSWLRAKWDVPEMDGGQMMIQKKSNNDDLELSQLRILGTPVQLEVDLYTLCRSFGQHPADESCYSLNLEHKWERDFTDWWQCGKTRQQHATATSGNDPNHLQSACWGKCQIGAQTATNSGEGHIQILHILQDHRILIEFSILNTLW